MYPEQLVAPMRQDLVSAGFQELKTTSEVESAINSKGTTLLVINSVCGCAAGAARPGAKLAIQRSKVKPDHIVTVFAGVDKEATQKAREFTLPYPPSSPSMALFKDGQLVHFVERHNIEGRNAEMIAQHLEATFEEYCQN
ncbi:MAG TPA: BrxA/BrxB family bacilliredoxin [Cytophagaceae bacterium]|jgi:putative YphP/YqiW family bacilliredoxin|nr:BrxA/BrxB family bacilliredoxin [Cytophagaceae bacterium]